MLAINKLRAMTPAQRFERLADALVVKNKQHTRATLSKGTEVFIAYGELNGNWHGLIGFVSQNPHAQHFNYDGSLSAKEVEQTALKYAEETSLGETITRSYAVN